MIKTNIKMRVTPEQSRRVQEICFENGINFYGNKTNKETIEADFLYVKKDKLTYGIYEDTFKSAEYEEIEADLFIKTNGTCEETYLTKYTSQPKDLESALKKIENLHIALKKKVEKNKNQALEITKLLEQKKDLQEINDTQNGYIKNLEANLRIKVDYISLIDTKIKELKKEQTMKTSLELIEALQIENKVLQFEIKNLKKKLKKAKKKQKITINIDEEALKSLKEEVNK